jgi:hypothetical protein
MSRFAVVLAWMLAFTAGSQALSGKQDFVLVNSAGITIAELYVAPSESDEWEEDVLGKDVLNHGEQVTITFDRAEKQCLYDIKTVDERGDSIEWADIDLCKARQVVIKPKGLADITN